MGSYVPGLEGTVKLGEKAICVPRKIQGNVHFLQQGKWTFCSICAIIKTYGKIIKHKYQRIRKDSNNKEEKQ